MDALTGREACLWNRAVAKALIEEGGEYLYFRVMPD